MPPSQTEASLITRFVDNVYPNKSKVALAGNSLLFGALVTGAATVVQTGRTVWKAIDAVRGYEDAHSVTKAAAKTVGLGVLTALEFYGAVGCAVSTEVTSRGPYQDH